MSDFKDKYLKYKLKYLRLKENNNNLQRGGVWNSTPIDFVNALKELFEKLGDESNYDIEQWNIKEYHRADNYSKETCPKIMKKNSFFDNIQSTLTYVKTKTSPVDNAVPPYVIPEIPQAGKQVVLGTLELIKPYFLYNEGNPNSPFLMLSSDDNTWSEDLNASFIICSLYNYLQNPPARPYTVRLVLPRNINNLIARYTDSSGVNREVARVTLKELFLLRKIFIELKLANNFDVYRYEPSHDEFDIYFFEPQ